MSSLRNREIPNLHPPVKGKILLHSCCAPCSAAIIETLSKSAEDFSVFYYNPNIFPREEYELRKSENMRFAESVGADFIDADYDHDIWLEKCAALSAEPERGGRCLVCFKLRLLKTAQYAAEHGYSVFTTTLSSSRWKICGRNCGSKILGAQLAQRRADPKARGNPARTRVLQPTILRVRILNAQRRRGGFG